MTEIKYIVLAGGGWCCIVVQAPVGPFTSGPICAMAILAQFLPEISHLQNKIKTEKYQSLIGEVCNYFLGGVGNNLGPLN